MASLSTSQIRIVLGMSERIFFNIKNIIFSLIPLQKDWSIGTQNIKICLKVFFSTKVSALKQSDAAAYEQITGTSSRTE